VQAAPAPLVQTATRRINTGRLRQPRRLLSGVSIIGIEPERVEVSLPAQNAPGATWLRRWRPVFIGKGLADAMGVGLNDRITLVGRSTHEQTRQRTMTVVGIYDLGMPDLEKSTVYVSLGEAQSLFDLAGQSTEVAIVLKQLGQEPKVIAAIEPSLPGYEIDTWRNNYPELGRDNDQERGDEHLRRDHPADCRIILNLLDGHLRAHS
jgi:ABC-type lipoprotein release transport system permease subunit